MDINAISIGPHPPKDIHVVIEIPLGGAPVKYELDKASGALRVDRFLHTAMVYPGNYGFIPHTLSADGDPCDVLVVSQVQVVPGAIVRCRPAGALMMEDEAGGDERSSRCRSTRSLRSIRIFAAIAICRRSCASRSRISFSTTRIWKRANGSRSSSGSTRRAPKSSCSMGLRAPPRRKRGTKSREVPHQRQSSQQAADRERDGKNDVKRREAKLAALVEQDGIERERGEGGVAAENAGGQE